MITKGLVKDAVDGIVMNKKDNLGSDQIKEILLSEVKDCESYVELKKLLRNGLFNDFSYSLQLYGELLRKLPDYNSHKPEVELQDDFELPLDMMSEKLAEMYSSTIIDKNSASKFLYDHSDEESLTNLGQGVFNDKSRQTFADCCIHEYKSGILQKFFSKDTKGKIVEGINSNLLSEIEDSIYSYLYDLFVRCEMDYNTFLENLLRQSHLRDMLDVDKLIKYHIANNIIYEINNSRNHFAVEKDKDFANRKTFAFKFVDNTVLSQEVSKLLHNLANEVKTKLESGNLRAIDEQSFDCVFDVDGEDFDETFNNVQKIEECLDRFDIINSADSFCDIIQLVAREKCRQDGMNL